MDNFEKAFNIKGLYQMLIKHIRLIIMLTALFTVGAYILSAVILPNDKKITALGFVLGLVIGCAVSIIIEMIDTKIKPEDDLYTMYGIPVFAEIVDFEANVKGGCVREHKNR